MKNRLILFALTAWPLCMAAQQNALQRAGHGINYNAEIQTTNSSGNTPLWLTANRYGLSSVDGNNGYARFGLSRSTSNDNGKWRIGYGIDLAAAYNFNSTFRIQQLYADFEYKLVRLSVGAKEQNMELKNNALSTGSQTLGINACPIPMVRFELPEYWSITGKSNWAAIKGHIGYGFLTDGRFLQNYQADGNHYARHALFHSKAGYLRLGNAEKFPLTFEGGLEMACQFGGTIYNAVSTDDATPHPIKMGHSLKDFVDATFGTGGDATDGEGYANATGNTVGSWLMRLNYHGKGWGASVYMDHFFEDHSQMFLQYGWKDALIGAELQLPANPVVSTIVYEHIRTTDQSGPVYHDHTEAIPDQISGIDNYYNHNLYAGWQHWGQAIGNPLFTSPLYNANGSLTFTNNRFKANHVGLSGNPSPIVQYRVLYTHQRSLGTYAEPFDAPVTSHSFMAEASFAPNHLGHVNTKGWKVTGAFALDHGSLIGNNTGFQLTISKSGVLVK